MTMRLTAQASRVLLFALLSGSCCAPVFGQKQPKSEPVALSEEIVRRLPAAYQGEARKFVKATPEDQQEIAKRSDENLAVWTLNDLAYNAEAAEFVVRQLQTESSAKLRATLIAALTGYWQTHPESRNILEQHAASDEDAEVSLNSLNELRALRLRELGKLLETRLALAKKSADTAGIAKLAKEQEIHYQWYGELTLPGFLRVTPPLFSIKATEQSIRVLAFGDFGFGNEAQKKTAAAMVDYHQKHPFDFGITLGDNFYTFGMDSPEDPRWQTQFEQLYGPMGIKIYPSFGNHDYGQPDSPAAEILYSQKSPDWRLPAPYYTYTAGPVQFFAIDTINLSETQLLWLEHELATSQAAWKVVYGHYPIFSATHENKELVEKLLPVLKKGNADVYIAGHHHNLQELKPDGKLHFFISGGGGATLYNVNPYDRALFKDKVNGFTVLEASKERMEFSFIDLEGRTLYNRNIEKAVSSERPGDASVQVRTLPVQGSIKVRSVIRNCMELLLYLTNISRGKAFPSAMQPALLGCKWSPLS